MKPADMHHRWGISVEQDGPHVILTIGTETVALSAYEARRFAFHLNRASQDAAYRERRLEQEALYAEFGATA